TLLPCPLLMFISVFAPGYASESEIAVSPGTGGGGGGGGAPGGGVGTGMLTTGMSGVGVPLSNLRNNTIASANNSTPTTAASVMMRARLWGFFARSFVAGAAGT